MSKKTFHWFGYVYLLQCGDLYKIGQSAIPRKRLKQLRTGSPHPIEVIHTLRTSMYKFIEKQLHAHFAEKRGNGEWFALDQADVEYIKSLDKHGRTPEEAREREASDAAYRATVDAQRQADEDQRLNVLLSGVASGAGDFCWI